MNKDLFDMTDDELKHALRIIPNDALLSLMKDESDEMKERIYSVLSDRAAQLLREDLK